MMADPTGKQFKLMKHWLRESFKERRFEENIETEYSVERKRNAISSLPKITFSPGSTTSLNSVVSHATSSNTTAENKQWVSSVEEACTHREFWAIRHQRSPTSQQKSYDQLSPLLSKQIQLGNFDAHTNQLRSPNLNYLQRFSNQTPRLGNLIPSVNSSRSELDSVHFCGACGQQKLVYGSPDSDCFNFNNYLYFDHQTLCSHDCETQSDTAKNYGKLHSKTYHTGTDKLEAHSPRRRSNTVKETFSIESLSTQRPVHRHPIITGGLKANSTLSLHCSYSVDTDPVQTFKTAKPQHDRVIRNSSLNENELHNVKTRRRQTTKLSCFDTKGCVSPSIIFEYSPKATRSDSFLNTDRSFSFKSLFGDEKTQSAHGQVKIMFQFFNDYNTFQVTLLRGLGIAQSQNGRLGIYTKICLMPGKKQVKICRDRHSTQNPKFNQANVFRVHLGTLVGQSLRLKLYNKPKLFSRAVPVGECNIPLYNYDLTAVTVLWQELQKC